MESARTIGRPSGPSAETEAASYWIGELDSAIKFLQDVNAAPVEDNGEPLVEIADAVSGTGIPVRLSEKPHVEGRSRIFVVRAGIVEPLLKAAESFARTGHTLLIEDAFRTREMQRDLAVSDDVLRKLVRVVYRMEGHISPASVINRLAAIVAAQPKTAGHMAGAAVDISVLDAAGDPLDRGGPYLSVDEVMPMASPFISTEASRNRRFTTEVMRESGFRAYPYEFWHYSMDDAFFRTLEGGHGPALYGALDPDLDGGWSPVLDPYAELNDRSRLLARIETLARNVDEL